MNIVGIVGSLREGSYNKMVMDYIVEEFGEKYGIREVSIGDLPLFNQGKEREKNEAVEFLRDKIRQADGVIFVTPEHNSSVPAALKNAIDWMSRVDPVLVRKPVMILGASIGFLGSVKAQLHLREILNTVGLESLIEPANEVVIGNIQDKVNGGTLVDEGTKGFINDKIEGFIDWIEYTKK